MATNPKKYFQLVNYEGQSSLDIIFGESNSSTDEWYFCDWDLDGNGNIKTIKKQEAMIQNTLKCVFTEKQANGYGTNIFDLIGQKDVMAKRISLMMDITMAIMSMKYFAKEQELAQNLSNDDIISTVPEFSVSEEEDNQSNIKIKMQIQTQSDETIPVSVL